MEVHGELWRLTMGQHMLVLLPLSLQTQPLLVVACGEVAEVRRCGWLVGGSARTGPTPGAEHVSLVVELLNSLAIPSLS